MAKTARKESEEVSDVKTPDYAKALRIIRQDIHPAEEDNASARGNLSGAWKAIEDDCHVNKAAAKLVSKMIGMSEEKRDDFLRGLYGMMRAAELGISRDLVDRATGTEETFPVEGERDDGLTDEERAFEAGKLDPVAGGISGGNLPPELKAMAEAGTTKPRAPKKAAPLKLVTVPETVN